MSTSEYEYSCQVEDRIVTCPFQAPKQLQDIYVTLSRVEEQLDRLLSESQSQRTDIKEMHEAMTNLSARISKVEDKDFASMSRENRILIESMRMKLESLELKFAVSESKTAVTVGHWTAVLSQILQVLVGVAVLYLAARMGLKP